ncbi:MAG: hypothetical protein WBG70_07745 [Spirulinaceae cyanobacterium]
MTLEEYRLAQKPWIIIVQTTGKIPLIHRCFRTLEEATEAIAPTKRQLPCFNIYVGYDQTVAKNFATKSPSSVSSG